MVTRRGYNQRNSSIGSYRKYKAPVFGTQKNVRKTEFKLPKHFWRFVIYLIILIAAGYYLFISKTFSIREVIIEGNHLVIKENLEKYVKRGSNILIFNSREIEKQILADFPEIKSLEIYRGLPDAVKIVVLEREAKIVWQVDEDKYLVSSQGVVMRKVADEDISGLPLILDRKQIPVRPNNVIVSPNFIAFVSNISENFFNTVNIKPTYFEVSETTFDLNLYTDPGFYVKLNSLRGSKKQLDSLKTVLVERRQEIHEYVDLRIDGWAYYK